MEGIKNAIIMDGVIHELVVDNNCKEGICHKCSLYNGTLRMCHNECTSIFGNNYAYFKKVES